MNGRQRLLAALRGEPVDRMPIWLLFPYHPTGYYVDVRAHAAYRPVVERIEAAGVTIDRRNPCVALFADEVEDRRESWDGGHRRIISWRGRSVEAVTERIRTERSVSTRVQPLLQNDADLEFFLDLPLNDDPRAIRHALDAQYAGLRAERDALPPTIGGTMFDCGEPINALYHAADLESYAIWSLTHADAIEAWLHRRQRALEVVYDWALATGLADCFFLVGSELAAPPLVSTNCFERWVQPFARALIDRIRRAGSLSIQHFHGQIRQLLPYFKDMAPDAIHTIEAPPVGDCTLAQAYAGLGTGITLIGNIQYDCFRSATPATMREMVDAVLDEVAGRRFILSPTAGPFDEDPSGRLIDNYLAFIEAGASYQQRKGQPC